MDPGRMEYLLKCIVLGHEKDEYVANEEEAEFWDITTAEVEEIKEKGGVVDFAWDTAGTPDDYLAHLYENEGG